MKNYNDMNDEKQKLVFKLLKEGKIDEEQAVILMRHEKEYVYVPAASPYIAPLQPYCHDTNLLS